jgi:hypothetical protein
VWVDDLRGVGAERGEEGVVLSGAVFAKGGGNGVGAVEGMEMV